VDFDQRIQTFRFLHLKLAQRIIGGNVIGTGGNPVDILRQRQEPLHVQRIVGVRNRITERSQPRPVKMKYRSRPRLNITFTFR